jgi:hypothetical protein
MGRATQTNEPARCAVLLPLLHRIGGPIALIELGAAAWLTALVWPEHQHRRDRLAAALRLAAAAGTRIERGDLRVPFALASGHADAMTVLRS